MTSLTYRHSVPVVYGKVNGAYSKNSPKIEGIREGIIRRPHVYSPQTEEQLRELIVAVCMKRSSSHSVIYHSAELPHPVHRLTANFIPLFITRQYSMSIFPYNMSQWHNDMITVLVCSRNLVSFGRLTPVFTRLSCVPQASISNQVSFATFARRQRC